jgi:hypothetical protein
MQYMSLPIPTMALTARGAMKSRLPAPERRSPIFVDLFSLLPRRITV